MIGQVMVNKRISYFDNKIEISHLSDGMYNVVLQDADGNIKHTSKIQKIKQ